MDHHRLHQGQELHSTRRISTTTACKHAVSHHCRPHSPAACLVSQTISESLFMSSVTCVPLPREGTKIDSLNYYPGVQERSRQGKAERVLCPRTCPQYIPGNRTRLVPSPEPLRRGATTRWGRGVGAEAKVPATGPGRQANKPIHGSRTNSDPSLVITQLLKNSPEGSEGQIN